MAADVRREIELPNLPGYQTLKCDLHTHTMFSDGSVWPPVRVDEAWRQGLDAIAVTDHIEYQPHKDDVPTNFNRSYELAAGRAREADLLFPKGAEITRDTPPGHFNAIFLKEIDPLATDDLVEAIGRANEQGAFVFWNHQGWKGSEKGRWLDVHTTLYEKKYLHGMEVCNGDEYYPEAHAWCLEKGLTMLGNSDIHDPDLRRQSTAADHRTMTLVMAKERTLDGLKEALVAGRTAVWYHEQLIGRREILEPLFAGVRSRRDAASAFGQRGVRTDPQRLRSGHRTDADRQRGPRRAEPARPEHERLENRHRQAERSDGPVLCGAEFPDRPSDGLAGHAGDSGSLSNHREGTRRSETASVRMAVRRP